MNILVALETRFVQTPDGKVWTQTMNAYPFWTRYLGVFNSVKVVARVHETQEVPSSWQRADGEGVSFEALPYYQGLVQFLLRFWEARREARKAFSPGDAVILRVSSVVASLIQQNLWALGYPYGVEVVGDPYDVFSPGAFRHPLRPLLRWWFTRQLRQQCARAAAAAYVTAEALQSRYPCPAYAVGISDVEINDAVLAATPRPLKEVLSPCTIVTVGSLEHFYKSPDVLIDAVAAGVREGLDLRLVLVGDGRHRPELEARAASQGLGERVQFLGQLTAGKAVCAQLDHADIFVLPSRQEGLPRALVEAMARALPCIGSTVGGIPELLPPEDLVPPGEVEPLTAKIREVIADGDRRAAMSARNLEKAKSYHDNLLQVKRRSFYSYLKNRTEEWLGNK